MTYLTTKLFRPRSRPTAVVRPRLFQQLDSALLNDSPLILVSAPPGFGKTTLISAWAAQSGLPSAWVSLDETDNDPIRFWSCLASASDDGAARPGGSRSPGFRIRLRSQIWIFTGKNW